MTAYAAAFAAAVGALVAQSVWLPLLVVVGVVALWRRGPVVVALAIGLLVSTAGHRALIGLDPPEPGNFHAWVTVVDDPRPVGRGVRATVRHEGRLLEATAHSVAGGRLDDVLAGERVELRGSVRPVAESDGWSRWNHVVGKVAVEEVGAVGAAPPVYAVANAIRRVLAGGADSLPRDDRALFLGMVIGDDREQSAVIADDFRAAGLGHLLVVSGQNVAFVLALASPLAVRLRPGPRLLALLVLLLLFALLTRFEPSVLRAVAMAGVGVAGTALGFPIDGRRTLAWAVALLLAVDPFLVHVVAFQLSVAATAGIVWLSGPLAGRLPGPRAPALAFATTAAAQLAVSPVLLATFGPVPLASLPANLLAGPASGPVMMWGCTMGLVAGVVGDGLATIIHLPTRGLVWWVRHVAATAAVAPAATVGVGGMLALSVSCAAAIPRSALVRLAGVGLACGVMVRSIVAVAGPPLGESRLGDGVVVVRHGAATVLVLENPHRARDVLETTRLSGVGRPDLVIATDGDAADAEAVLALADRYGPIPVLAPPLHRVPGARVARSGQVVEWKGATIEIVDDNPSVVAVVR